MSGTVPEQRGRIVSLECCCCGGGTTGRQWWNRDTGYGICVPCGVDQEQTESPATMISYYGHKGVHWFVEDWWWCVTRDKKRISMPLPSSDACMEWLLRYQSSSTHHAIKHEGYDIIRFTHESEV